MLCEEYVFVMYWWGQGPMVIDHEKVIDVGSCMYSLKENLFEEVLQVTLL